MEGVLTAAGPTSFLEAFGHPTETKAVWAFSVGSASCMRLKQKIKGRLHFWPAMTMHVERRRSEEVCSDQHLRCFREKYISMTCRRCCYSVDVTRNLFLVSEISSLNVHFLLS